MIAKKLDFYKQELLPYSCKLVPISKTKHDSLILEAYETGNKVFGENKVQELVGKYESLPKDIEWHYVGHLQRNKVKYIAPFVKLIHAVDSGRLLTAINKEGQKNNRVINCLLQVHIAQEEAKFGFSEEELFAMIKSIDWQELKNIKVIGLMGMATNTSDNQQVRREFKYLANIKSVLHKMSLPPNIEINELSMGMSNDYKLALEEGSTMIRIGTDIFGARTNKTNE